MIHLTFLITNTLSKNTGEVSSSLKKEKHILVARLIKKKKQSELNEWSKLN